MFPWVSTQNVCVCLFVIPSMWRGYKGTTTNLQIVLNTPKNPHLKQATKKNTKDATTLSSETVGKHPMLSALTIKIEFFFQLMIDPVTNNRPSATALTQHPVLCPLAAKSKVPLIFSVD